MAGCLGGPHYRIRRSYSWMVVRRSLPGLPFKLAVTLKMEFTRVLQVCGKAESFSCKPSGNPGTISSTIPTFNELCEDPLVGERFENLVRDDDVSSRLLSQWPHHYEFHVNKYKPVMSARSSSRCLSPLPRYLTLICNTICTRPLL